MQPHPPDTILIITAGNVLRADDGVGPYIARHLPVPRDGILVLDAGERPENIIDRAVGAKPVRTVIIDAAEFGGVSGEARIIPPELIEDHIVSTHAFPLSGVAEIIRCDTGSEVAFLGIQMGSKDFAEGLSVPVEQTAHEIIALLSP
ncbi:MAG: hydrogenase 3 maturation endopeptidase HyCI [Nitrospirales bacterium]|nr:hydrogenase 3 maturation endopeptidase HyCI [Nitrospirales bacterium]